MHTFPFASVRAFLSAERDVVLLESARPDAENAVSYLYARPERVLASDAAMAGDGEAARGFLAALEAAAADGLHAAGYLTYEFGHGLVPGLAPPPALAPGPLAWFGLYPEVAVFDHATGAWREPVPGWLAAALAKHADGLTGMPGSAPQSPQCAAPPTVRRTPPGAPHSRLSIPRARYLADVAWLRDRLADGEAYQVNHTLRVAFAAPEDPLVLYTALRDAQPVPYASLVRVGGDDPVDIVSASPELFFRLENGRVTARPMKGTAPRGLSAEDDAAAAAALAADPKERAENLMITDLLRNDLGRVCQPGSVQTPVLFATERHPTLWQLTSTVHGTLRDGLGIAAALGALFPCGSVTGAPKRRAMELIAERETSPRGLYTGAIGRLAPGGDAAFSVAIRTAVLRGNSGGCGARGELGVGSGITHDSVPRREFAECLLKTRFLRRPRPEARLIETMLWQDGLAHLDGHLARLSVSAAYFGYGFDALMVLDALDKTCRALPAGIAHRVRLTLGRDGAPTVETAPYDGTPGRDRVVLSPRRVSSRDPFLYHKTTRRELYTAERERLCRGPVLDVLFANERGEVTEGAITNVYARFGDRLVTPPVACGLLPGTLRARLLATRDDIEERIIAVEDLSRADALFVGNALLGLREVRLAGA